MNDVGISDDTSEFSDYGPSDELMRFNERANSPMLPRELFLSENRHNTEGKNNVDAEQAAAEDQEDQSDEEFPREMELEQRQLVSDGRLVEAQSEWQAEPRAEDVQAKLQAEQAPDEHTRSPSSSSSSDDEDGSSSSDEDGSIENGSTVDTDNDTYEDDDGLSDYERLRLRNIRRNEARLAQLGLLTKVTTSNNSVDEGTSKRRSLNGTSAMTELLISDSNNGQKQPRKKKQSMPVPRRSLPRRRCAKIKRWSLGSNNPDEEYSDNGYSSDESSQASPIKIIKTLRPQPHQELAFEDEQGLKHYRKTRRSRRGRPKREEYVYSCNEVCKVCGGGWKFDNSTGVNKENENCNEKYEEGSVGCSGSQDLEERTRLIRCKGCQSAFHLTCILTHDKKSNGDGSEVREEEGDAGEDRKPAATTAVGTGTDASSESTVVANVDDEAERESAHDPKRCHHCEAKYKLEKQQSCSSASSYRVLSLLDATVDDRIVQVRVTPEPALEATVNGMDVTCYVAIEGQASSRDCSNYSSIVSYDDGEAGKDKQVHWNSPLEQFRQVDAVTMKIQKLINKALSDGNYAQLQDHSCAALRKYISSKESAAKVVNLGGITMLVNAMENHPDRPIIQAEALCTLAEIAWADPTEFGVGTIDANGLDLALAAMERHGVHSKVLQMGCGYFRALSYDTKACAEMRKYKVVECVVESVVRNPRKVNVMMEGSMFLQNMMVVSPNVSIKPILKPKRGDDARPDLLPTLLKAIQVHSANADLIFSVFGLLLNVASNVRGKTSLCSLGVDALAMDVIRDHPGSPDLHEVSFALLQNTMNVEENSDEHQMSTTMELVQLILQSMEKHLNEENVQINACKLLGVMISQTQSVESLVRNGKVSRIFESARQNFPESCKDLVDGLLCG